MRGFGLGVLVGLVLALVLIALLRQRQGRVRDALAPLAFALGGGPSAIRRMTSQFGSSEWYIVHGERSGLPVTVRVGCWPPVLGAGQSEVTVSVELSWIPSTRFVLYVHRPYAAAFRGAFVGDEDETIVLRTEPDTEEVHAHVREFLARVPAATLQECEGFLCVGVWGSRAFFTKEWSDPQRDLSAESLIHELDTLYAVAIATKPAFAEAG